MPENLSPWPLWKRLAFRFLFLYWALYISPAAGQGSLVDAIPGINDKLNTWLSWPLQRLSHWVGLHVLHLTGEGADWHPTGSGDTAMNYVLFAVMLVLALLGTAVWSAIDERRGRREYHTAYAWLRLAMRLTLAITMFEYGFVKIFPGQFGLKPSLAELSETYGESSPMHVLWFFMTVSRPYTIFGGFGEVIPGVLLLFRRTSTLGALGTAAVMANVVALNFCYDVPVKLYSSHLFLMAVFLLLPDLKPMLTFFVARRPAELTGVWLPVPERRPLRIGARVAQVLFLILCAWSFIGGSYTQRVTAGTDAPIHGVWTVDSATGVPAADVPRALVADGMRSIVWMRNGAPRQYASAKYDAAKQQLRLTNSRSDGKDTVFTWKVTDGRFLKLDGQWKGAPATMTLHRTDPATFPLTSRGFHWVQERAFNN